METIRVLDHGTVKLEDYMGNDNAIVRSARVSFDGDNLTELDPLKDANLVRYLMDNQHTSPFESVTFTFYIKAPIFVFRQWHRHRTWSYNEVSARYTTLPDEMFIPSIRTIGEQSKSSKQARIMGDLKPERRKKLEASLLECENSLKFSYQTYKRLMDNYDWPRETARIVLPFAIYSKMYATVNLHNLFHFLGLRMHEHAQYEIRVYAGAMYKLISEIVPLAVACFDRVRKQNEQFKTYLADLRKKERDANKAAEST